MMEGPGADSEEKHEPVSDIDTAVVVVGLKALDPEWPIREDCSASSSTPMMEGPGADSEEKHEPASDINTVVVDSLKRLTRNGRLEKRTLVGDLRVRGLEHDPEKACPRT